MTTEFEERVYEALTSIPEGYVTTYAHLAHALGTQAYQAVGNALRKNPHAPEIPCHRVVRSDRTLGGYAGETSGEGPARKRRLLQEEGVRFTADGRVREEHLYRFN